jgi:hypothetical protein
MSDPQNKPDTSFWDQYGPKAADVNKTTNGALQFNAKIAQTPEYQQAQTNRTAPAQTSNVWDQIKGTAQGLAQKLGFVESPEDKTKYDALEQQLNQMKAAKGYTQQQLGHNISDRGMLKAGQTPEQIMQGYDKMAGAMKGAYGDVVAGTSTGLNAFLMGAPNALESKFSPDKGAGLRQIEQEHPIGSTVGTLAGTGASLALPGLGELAGVKGATLGAKVLKGAITGAGQAIPRGVFDGIRTGDWKKAAAEAGLGTVLGAGTGALMGGVTKLQDIPKVGPAIQKVLANKPLMTGAGAVIGGAGGAASWNPNAPLWDNLRNVGTGALLGAAGARNLGKGATQKESTPDMAVAQPAADMTADQIIASAAPKLGGAAPAKAGGMDFLDKVASRIPAVAGAAPSVLANTQPQGSAAANAPLTQGQGLFNKTPDPNQPIAHTLVQTAAAGEPVGQKTTNLVQKVDDKATAVGPEATQKSIYDTNQVYQKKIDSTLKSVWWNTYGKFGTMAYKDFYDTCKEQTDGFDPRQSVNILFGTEKERQRYLNTYDKALQFNKINVPAALAYGGLGTGINELLEGTGGGKTSAQKLQHQQLVQAMVSLAAGADQPGGGAITKSQIEDMLTSIRKSGGTDDEKKAQLIQVLQSMGMDLNMLQSKGLGSLMGQ